MPRARTSPYVTPAAVKIAIDRLTGSESSIDFDLRIYLSNYLQRTFPESAPTRHRIPIRRNPMTDFPAPDSDPLAVIGYVANGESDKRFHILPERNDLYLHTMLYKSPSPAQLFLQWGTAFIATCLSELRKIICGDGKTPKKLSGHTQGGLAALATFLMQQYGFTNATATGLAVLILIKVGQAAKNAFCKTTDKDFLASLARNADESEEHIQRSLTRKAKRNAPKRKNRRG
jgi:hypothetical protein